MFPRHLMAAMLASVAVGLAGVSAAPVDGDSGQKPVIVKLKPGQDVQAKPRVMVLSKTANPDAEADDAEPAARNIEAGGPWLGVQFGPVPRPLASHLKLDAGASQMVLNVATGSPADVSGMQQYDVITSIDGNAVSGDMGEFLDMVRGFAPNETHQFSVIRGGAPMNLRMVVGTRPENWQSLKYKYEVEEEPLAGGQFFQRGGMFEKDAQGNWLFKDLHNLGDMHDLFSKMPKMGPDDLQLFWHGAAPDHMNQMQVHIDRGNEVRIEKDESGKITVTRKERDGADKTTKVETFDDEAAFEAGDPEAYKMFKSGVGGQNVFKFMTKPHGAFMFDPDANGFKFDMDDAELRETVEKARKQAEEARKQADQFHQKFKIRTAPQGGDAVTIERTATTSFEVDADGSVRVTSRSEGTELVERFSSIDAMKTARPDLYEKYQAVRGQ